LHEYLGGCVRALDATSLRVGGVADHVHLLVEAKPIHAPANVIREIKKASTAWIHENFHRKFAWQEGYGAFSVSRSIVDAVARYIDHQEEHHKRRSFQDEYLGFLQELEIEFDPRYLW
jgi:REP element-mobilizing transposase RayT